MPGAEARKDEFVEFRDFDTLYGAKKRVDVLFKMMQDKRITPEQYDGGNAYRELREAWETAAMGQKPFDDLAAGVAQTDPFAGWHKAVRYGKDGKPVREPRTFAYKRPKAPKTANDGFNPEKCDAMQAHLRVFHIFRATPLEGQVIYNAITVERLSLSEAAKRIRLDCKNNRHHRAKALAFLCSTLDALANELKTEPA